MSAGKGGMLARLVAFALSLREPGDPETEAGRARGRHRAIAFTTLASFIARALSVLTALLSIPLTLHYLGVERFGMWAALSALSAFFSFADFGIGNSLLTAVAKGSGRDDPAEIGRQIASAYAAMGAIAGLLLALVALAYPFVSWAAIFNVSSPQALAEAGPAAAMFLTIMVLATPIGLVQRIQLGLQQGHRASLWQGAGSLAALLALIVATRLEASLPWLVLALAGTPVLVGLVNAIDFFVRSRPDLRPRLQGLDLRAMHRISSDGLLFLILQVCGALLFQINALIIARVLGAEAVADYAVPDRMFAIVASILMTVLTPLWPAYGDAMARGDYGWVRRTLRRSLVLALGGTGVLSAVLVLAGPHLIRWWVGEGIVVPFALLAGFWLWRMLEVVGISWAMFLNGINQLSIQVAAALGCVAISIPLRWWAANMFGLPGVLWATIASYGLVVLPLMAVAVRRELRKIAL